MSDDTDPIRTAVPGINWPAIPSNPGALALALQYQLQQTQWWPPERLLAHQFGELTSIIRHAVATVPLYAQRFAGLGLEEPLTPERYRRLPVLRRSEVQAASSTIVSRAVPAEHGRLNQTESSGSTGQPIITVGTDVTQLFWRALLLREHLWHRRDLGGKLAAIRSKTTNASLPGWGPATDSAFRTGPLVVRDISTDLDDQVAWLAGQNPDYLISFATNVYMLAQRSRERGIRLPRLREARTYGEVIRPDLRRVVRESWGVGVVDTYSSEELGYIALQCPEQEHYHVQSENLMVEVLRPDGTGCNAGEVGELVVTTLHNYAMPLIRYASGDFAEVGGSCPCGRGLPVLKRILGRQRNMVVRPDGVRHWPSFPSEAWRDAAPIRQLQLVQDALDHVEARLVLPRELTPEEGMRLTGILQKCLGYPFRITLRRVGEIERGRGMKYEDFISHVGE